MIYNELLEKYIFTSLKEEYIIDKFMYLELLLHYLS